MARVIYTSAGPATCTDTDKEANAAVGGRRPLHVAAVEAIKVLARAAWRGQGEECLWRDAAFT
jgi:hypothetical protein